MTVILGAIYVAVGLGFIVWCCCDPSARVDVRRGRFWFVASVVLLLWPTVIAWSIAATVIERWEGRHHG